jgi:hypothetical protein
VLCVQEEDWIVELQKRGGKKKVARHRRRIQVQGEVLAKFTECLAWLVKLLLPTTSPSFTGRNLGTAGYQFRDHVALPTLTDRPVNPLLHFAD